MKPIDVISFGNPILDIHIRVPSELEEALFEELNIVRGRRYDVSAQKIATVIATARGRGLEPVVCTGCSAANTIATLRHANRNVWYFGQVGDDAAAATYQRLYESHRARTLWSIDPERSTGQAIVFVSEFDGERTQLVHLGASSTFRNTEEVHGSFRRTKVIHVVGYTLLDVDMARLVLRAVSHVRNSGGIVTFDASDPIVLSRAKEFVQLLLGTADVVFLNQAEREAWVGHDDLDRGLDEIAKLRPSGSATVLKNGVGGSLVHCEGDIWAVPACQVTATDTTGAGDAYAAGFIDGILQGWDMSTCAQQATLYAAACVQTHGGIPTIDPGLRDWVSRGHLAVNYPFPKT